MTTTNELPDGGRVHYSRIAKVGRHSQHRPMCSPDYDDGFMSSVDIADVTCLLCRVIVGPELPPLITYDTVERVRDLSIRDVAALVALRGLLARPTATMWSPDEIVEVARSVANRFMEQRKEDTE